MCGRVCLIWQDRTIANANLSFLLDLVGMRFGQTLDAWSQMPGSSAATEALLRGEHHARDGQEVLLAALASATSLSHLLDCCHLGSLSVSVVSLSATMRKLLWPFLHVGGTPVQEPETAHQRAIMA